MSGPGDGKRKCSCLNNRCLRGNCSCFKTNSFCSGCSCKNCKNIKDNKDEVDSQYKVYLKRNGPVVLEHPNVPPGGIPVPLGDGHRTCSCKLSQCLKGNCICFKAHLSCSNNCSCNDCRNKEHNKDEVDSRHKVYLKRKSPGVAKMDADGCGCQVFKCHSKRCSCYKNYVMCTSECKCKDCTNGKYIRKRKGDARGVSNTPGKAVQTKPS